MSKASQQSAAKADNDGVIEAPQYRSPYRRRRVQLVCDPATDRTQQSFRDDCDINKIMARYLKTGVLPVSDRQPVYLDTTAYDFMEAANLVARARGEFSLLPAEERDAYGNQVELWLEHKAVLAAQDAEDAAKAASEGGTPSQAPASPQGDPRASQAPAKGEPAKPATPPAHSPS